MGVEGESRMEPEDRVTGRGQSEGMQQGRTGWEKRCDRSGERKDRSGREAGQIGERQGGWLIWRKGWDRPGEGERQEQGGGASLGEEAVRNTDRWGRWC